jgi:hypothetical protein
VRGRRRAVHLPVQTFHPRVELGRRAGGIRQLVEQLRRHLAVVLVVDLVLEARPEVHRDRPDLHLDADGVRPRRQEHRHLHDEVQALVAVLLRLGDVVLDADDAHVLLGGEQLGDPVGVRDEAAGDAHAGDVGDGLPDRVERGLDALAAHLVHHAVEALEPARDVLDGVVGMRLAEFLAQDREFGDHFVHAELEALQEALGLVAQRPHLVERLPVDRVERALRPIGQHRG